MPGWALMVADEQHRFGVAQRAALAAKGDSPHVLVMSATPIPRTLALIIYGDLDVSVIDELPPGRTPVETYVVREDKRARMYNFVRRLVGEGRQVYIICPAVEEKRRGPQCRIAEWEGDGPVPRFKGGDHLRQKAPDGGIPRPEGGLPPREDEAPGEGGAVMAAFAARGDPGAGVHHRHRGGRWTCPTPPSSSSRTRSASASASSTSSVAGWAGESTSPTACSSPTPAAWRPCSGSGPWFSTTDGFKISEEDLKLRGPGDFFGSRQHGLPQMKLADLAGDMRLLSEAQDSARRLLMADPTLSQPENRPVLERVRTLFSDTPDIFN